MKDKSISLEIFKIVMDSVQTGDLHVNQKSIFEVLAASQLQMASVVQLCCDFVKKEFIENRIDLKNYSVLCTVAVICKRPQGPRWDLCTKMFAKVKNS